MGQQDRVAPRYSRRALLAGASSIPFAGAVHPLIPSASLGVGELCRSWLSMEAEARLLSDAWGDLEAHLIEQYSWFKLTEEEQGRHPCASQLKDLDDRQDIILEKQSHLLSVISTELASSLGDVIAKLTIVEELICELEGSEVRTLLNSAMADIARVTSRVMPSVR